MTLQKFKKIRTGVTTFQRNTNWNDTLYSVEINGKEYSRSKTKGKLTSKQLDYFKYINDFNGVSSINM